MDINVEIQKATDKFIEEKLPAMVSEKVQKMVDGVLNDVFSNYSDSAKNIKEKIQEKLDINLQEFDMIDYNGMISKAINDKLIENVNANAVEPIMELVSNTLGFLKKKDWKVSEIQEMIEQSIMEDNGDQAEGEFSFHVIENEKHGWHSISFDLDAHISPENCSLEFIVSKDHGNIFSFRTKERYYDTKKKAITPSRVTQLSHIEHKIYRLYSAGVKVTIDETDFDNSWNRYN